MNHKGIKGDLCVFLIVYVLVFSTALAQEDLPELVRRIESSILVILTYDSEGRAISQGSGFFINENGDIITNFHVLQEASRVVVKTSDGKLYPVTEILAEDVEGDIVRISANIPRKFISPLPISTSIPNVGEKVLVIGSPLGLEGTVADGIVSAVRDTPDSAKTIQITAPLSQGSSGSPVVNMKGEVIGVATYRVINGQNLNFAISSERITKLIPQKAERLADWKNRIEEKGIDSEENLMSIAWAYMRSGEYEKAITYFKKFLVINSKSSEAYFLVGWCYSLLEHHAEALEAYKKSIEIKPNVAIYHRHSGNAYLGLKRYDDALEAFKKAIQLNPEDAEAYNLLGYTYRLLDLNIDAIEAFKEAIRVKPDLAKAYKSLGHAYSRLKRKDDAIEAYKKAIQLDPEDVEAYASLGNLYVFLNRYLEAVEISKQAIRIKPDNYAAHVSLGLAYGALGRTHEAIDESMVALRLNPDDPDAYLSLAGVYLQTNRFDEAIIAFKESIRLCKKIIHLNPYNYNARSSLGLAHYYLGITYLGAGKKFAALDEYKILKTLDMDLANDLFDVIYK